jgi:S-adenosylmethionine:tRNA ribosyltransferase-isomerase
LTDSPLNISISDFTYDLPQDRIALFPLEQREDSKLLVYREGEMNENQFKNIADFLPENTVLIFNTTKVVKARLNFQTKSHHTLEVFCLGPAGNTNDPATAMELKGRVRWLCLVGNLKRWKEEEELVLSTDEIALRATLVSKNTADVELEFNWTPLTLSFYEVIEQLGAIPIPPYLKRQSAEIDTHRYQTIYADKQGSVAAPTAGLHFTEPLMAELKDKGVGIIPITLHVGAGTFKPVKSEKIAGHEMHPEWMDFPIATIQLICDSIEKNSVCVGTTSLRALESIYWMGLKTYLNPEIPFDQLEISQWEVYSLNQHEVNPRLYLNALINWLHKNKLSRLCCRTQILIAPPYELKMAKGIITNFHQPQSTLLLLIAAVVGNDWKKIYAYALEHDFRFLSYGDSSLLLK